jgi:hypothetical protein
LALCVVEVLVVLAVGVVDFAWHPTKPSVDKSVTKSNFFMTQVPLEMEKASG